MVLLVLGRTTETKLWQVADKRWKSREALISEWTNKAKRRNDVKTNFLSFLRSLGFLCLLELLCLLESLELLKLLKVFQGLLKLLSILNWLNWSFE